MTASATQTYYVATSTSAVSQGWATWSDGILVDAGAVATTTFLYITTDGSTPSASNFNYILQGGQSAVVANRQPKLNSLQAKGDDALDFASNGSGFGITSQSVPASLWTSGYPTFVSVVASAAGSNEILVEQR
jgi:hypothetical protein